MISDQRCASSIWRSQVSSGPAPPWMRRTAGPDPNRSTAICSKTDISGRTVPARRWLRIEGVGELAGLRHRSAAGEVLADVRRRATLDGGALAEQLGPVASLRAAGEDYVRSVGRAHDTCQLPQGGMVGRAVAVRGCDQGDLADGGEVEVDCLEQMPERVGVLAGRRGEHTH